MFFNPNFKVKDNSKTMILSFKVKGNSQDYQSQHFCLKSKWLCNNNFCLKSKWLNNKNHFKIKTNCQDFATTKSMTLQRLECNSLSYLPLHLNKAGKKEWVGIHWFITTILWLLIQLLRNILGKIVKCFWCHVWFQDDKSLVSWVMSCLRLMFCSKDNLSCLKISCL